MLIIGSDYHPGFQQIAFVDTDTGEYGERKLTHKEEAESFYRGLNGRTVRVGMEARGHARWFERLLAELNIELWIGDPAEIRAKRVRKQKTDRQDAEHLLKLLVEDRFPRILIPSPENRDKKFSYAALGVGSLSLSKNSLPAEKNLCKHILSDATTDLR